MNLSFKIGAGGIVMPAPIITQTAVGPIQHIDAGQGAALLSLHGGLGGFDQSWLLAQAFFGEPEPWRVLALSRPGYLDTPLTTGRTSEAQADAYVALLDKLGIERTVVAAISAAGPSAIQFAARYPDRCRGLILVSAVTGQLDVPLRVKRRLRMVTWLVRIPGMQAWLKHKILREPEKAARRSITDPRVRKQTLADPEAGGMFLALQESVMTRSADRLQGTANDTRLFGTLPDLSLDKLQAPVLVIHGMADAVVSFNHAERVARTIPGARFEVITGGEHVVLFTHLERVRAAASEFLAAL